MKNRKLLALLLVFTMVLGCMLLPVAADDPAPDVWDGTSASAPTGEGTTGNPYQISNGAELKWISDQAVAAHASGEKYEKRFVLTADIDLGGHEWIPIGVGPDLKKAYRGIFDGQNHTVSNFKVTTQQNAGLFGALGAAQVKNLKLDNITIAATPHTATSKGYAGALSGFMTSGTQISNVTVGENVTVTGYYAGGIIGYMEGSNNKISYCVNNASVSSDGLTGAEFVGGIVGIANGVTISYCMNNGNISSTVSKGEQVSGGIVGRTGLSGGAVVKVEYCLNTGSISSIHTAGGIVGKNIFAGCTYENCVSVGTVVKGSLTDYSGTLVGRFAATGSIINCYAKYTADYGVTGKNTTSLNNCTQTNVNICQTEEELKTLNAYAAAIQKAVAKQGTLRPFVIAEGVSFKGVQEYVHDGKFNVRFVSSVDDYTKYSDIGFTVTATYTDGTAKTKNFEKHCSAVYASLYAVNGDKVAYPEYAQEWQGNSLAAYSIRNIPATVGTVTFTVTPFYVKDGVRTECQSYQVVYTEGVFVSATAVETAE